MSEYHRQRVDLLIRVDSEIYRRVAARAAKDGVSVENVIAAMIGLGGAKALEAALDYREELER